MNSHPQLVALFVGRPKLASSSFTFLSALAWHPHAKKTIEKPRDWITAKSEWWLIDALIRNGQIFSRNKSLLDLQVISKKLIKLNNHVDVVSLLEHLSSSLGVWGRSPTLYSYIYIYIHRSSMIWKINIAKSSPQMLQFKTSKSSFQCSSSMLATPAHITSSLLMTTAIDIKIPKCFKHADTLNGFNFGRLSGSCGSFNPSSPVRVW